MRANYYTNLKMICSGEYTAAHELMPKIMRILHGIMSNHEGKYAIALPRSRHGESRSLGDTIRVFANSSEDLYRLFDAVDDKILFDRHVKIDLPKPVPIDFGGTWHTWKRARIQRHDGANRVKTVDRAKSSPYMTVRSTRNSQEFQLRFHKEPAERQTIDFTPNSFGLASNESPFSLPDL